MKPAVTAIVVTYQSADVIEECMSALYSAYQAGILECIVVDNVSTDGTRAILQKYQSWAQMVLPDENLGYGRGCNEGLKRAKTKYVMFMNPDVIIDASSTEALAEFMNDHPAAGIAAPAIQRAKGDWQVAGGLPTPAGIVKAALGFSSSAKHKVQIVPHLPPFKTDWLCGALLFARKTLLDELQGFDPRFFLYFEETDLCVRATKQGAELWAVAEAVAKHYSNSSARAIKPDLPDGGCLPQFYFESRFYYLAKHHGLFSALGIEAVECLILALKDLYHVAVFRPSRLLLNRIQLPVFKFPKKVSDGN